MTPTITFGGSATETVISEFGWSVDSEGIIVDSGGEVVEATDGEEIDINSFGGVVSDSNGNPTPIRDDFISTRHTHKSQ